jgi:hypothetical protein
VSRTPRRSPGPWDWVGLGALILLWIPTLAVPFSGDQALFITGARQLAAGGVYYRDFWDLKQPGIYWFYEVAHLLPGPDLLDVRLLDLGWTLATGLLVLIAARSLTDRRWLRAAAPAIVLAPYQLTAGANGLTQIETLVGLPLLAALLLAAPPDSGSGRMPQVRLVAAGAIGASAIVLKTPYGVVLAVLAIAVAVRWRHRLHAAGVLALCAVGAAVPLLMVIGYYAAHHCLDLLWVTTVVEPPRVAARPAFRAAELYPALAVRAAVVLGPAVALAAMTLARRHTPQVFTVAAWALATLAVVAVQRPSPYQAYAMAVPLGLLAVAGLDVLARRLATRPTALLVLVALLAVPLVLVGARGAVSALTGGRPPSRNADIDAAATDLPSSITDGTAPIFVIGDPLWYVRLGRAQAVECNGWSPELASSDQWRELERELRRSRPRAIFVNRAAGGEVEAGAPGILGLLATGYRVVSIRPGGDDDAGAGTWWLTDEPGPPTPTDDGNQLAAAG